MRTGNRQRVLETGNALHIETRLSNACGGDGVLWVSHTGTFCWAQLSIYIRTGNLDSPFSMIDQRLVGRSEI
jgi:hypothetical protein